jgi:CubicO group peptidase (beta-lactamase class C family)
MFLKPVLASMALSVSCFAFAACSSPQAITETPITAAHTLLDAWEASDAPGVAVSIMKDGEIVFSSGEGLANLEHNVPITPNTVFRVASVSKQFTAFSVLLLVSEGQLSLDDDIRTYFPELADTGEVITVRHLLDHLSGLREVGVLTAIAGWLEDDIRTRDQVMKLLLRQDDLNFKPGEHFSYSNSGYFLLAELVEKVSGQSFSEFTQTRIFDPLGMSQTRFHTDRNMLVSGKATSYNPTGEGYAPILLLSENVGSAGLLTTTEDLLKWADNFQNQTVGDDSVFSMMAKRVSADDGVPAVFGRGQEQRTYNGLDTWSHGGRNGGFRSFVLRAPQEDFALSIISNRSDFDTAKLAYALVDTFLAESENYEPEAEEVWTPATPTELLGYVGTYELYPGTIFDLTVQDGQLHFSMLNSPDASPVPQTGEHQFVLNPNSDLFLEFEMDENGKASGVYYRIGLHGRLIAKRVELETFDANDVVLDGFAGTYFSDELATFYELEVQDGALIAVHARAADITLEAYQQDTFMSPGGQLQKVEFLRDEAGRVTGFEASAPLVDEVVFQRVN